jgi:6-phosphogluconolactonase (cycloisomerase 2 family)
MEYSVLPNQSVGIDSLGYSQFASALLWVGTQTGLVQSVSVLPNGELGEPSDPFYFTGGSNSDMDVSPNGRFVAIIGIDRPQLTILSVTPSGTFGLVESLTFGLQNSQRIRYTPDGRYLLMLFSEGDFLVSMMVNSSTGAVTQVDHASLDPDALGGYPIDALAITPDSKYVVTLSGNLATNEQTFLVFRLEEDGQLTRITQVRNDWPGYVSDMDFIPPYREPETAAGTGWMLYQ